MNLVKDASEIGTQRDSADWYGSPDLPCKQIPEVFQPLPGERAKLRRTREALCKMLCGRCNYEAPCRNVARRDAEFGYWGGEGDEAREKWWDKQGLVRFEFKPKVYVVMTKAEVAKIEHDRAARKAATAAPVEVNCEIRPKELQPL